MGGGLGGKCGVSRWCTRNAALRPRCARRVDGLRGVGAFHAFGAMGDHSVGWTAAAVRTGGGRRRDGGLYVAGGAVASPCGWGTGRPRVRRRRRRCLLSQRRQGHPRHGWGMGGGGTGRAASHPKSNNGRKKKRVARGDDAPHGRASWYGCPPRRPAARRGSRREKRPRGVTLLPKTPPSPARSAGAHDKHPSGGHPTVSCYISPPRVRR